jgi:hypothetical protein
MTTPIDIAKKEVGYKEGTNNDNKYGVWFGLNHQPWCMIFVVWCFFEAGLQTKILKTAGVEAFEAWAIKNKFVIPVDKIQANDLLLFDWDHAGHAEHIEIAAGGIDPKTHLVPTVGGNTGPDHIGVNQSNGDGVYSKVRATSVIRTVIRIPN